MVEMEKKMAQLQVQRALQHKVSAEADSAHQVGYEVLVSGKNQLNNGAGEWRGALILSDVDSEPKLAYAKYSKGADAEFGMAQVNKYLRPDKSSRCSWTLKRR